MAESETLFRPCSLRIKLAMRIELFNERGLLLGADAMKRLRGISSAAAKRSA